MAKDVRIIVKGVQEALPEDRIAYLVNSVMGHRSTSVAVEELGKSGDPETGDKRTQRRMAETKKKIRETQERLGESGRA